MRINPLSLILACGVALPVLAQDQPLSVIDWLDRHPGQPALTSVGMPPSTATDIAPTATVPVVSVKPLEGTAVQIIGVVPASVTGLPQGLWRGSDPRALSRRIDRLPDFRLPAAQALLYTVLLTEALSPGKDGQKDDLFTLARVEALQKFGALDPAMTLMEQSGVTRDAAHFDAYMDIALLTGQEDQACAVLAANVHVAPGFAHRIFCAARDGDWTTAALLFDSASALGLLTPDDASALEHFLHPELFDDGPRLTAPDTVTPLLFRIHEAIGEPLPTRSLPLAYSVADLRDVAGWKAQLEAAERLALTGALPDNRLLGIYTERLPAASGGVWDRVAALQRFETALGTRSPDAVSKTLPRAWAAMQSAGLEVTFANLFAADLATLTLTGTANSIAQAAALLSNNYQTAALPDGVNPLLRGVARGNVTGVRPTTSRADAIVAGFGPNAARSELLAMASQGKRGEAILRSIVMLENGASGDLVALSDALGTLRALGLEDTARRGALQVLLLDRYN